MNPSQNPSSHSAVNTLRHRAEAGAASPLNMLAVQTLFMGLLAATALVTLAAHAQTAEPASAATLSSKIAPAVSAAPAAPRYAAQDVERAFGYIDSNHDGKISRAEAAGFRNVAKYFDAADLNKDNALSREEFENALNGSKPQ